MSIHILPNGEHIEFFFFNAHKVLITSNPEFPDKLQVRLLYNSFIDEKLYIAQLFYIKPNGEITGSKKAFIQDQKAKQKIVFEVDQVNNFWNGLFKGYISSETEPTLFAIFKNHIKEGEEIEF